MLTVYSIHAEVRLTSFHSRIFVGSGMRLTSVGGSKKKEKSKALPSINVLSIELDGSYYATTWKKTKLKTNQGHVNIARYLNEWTHRQYHIKQEFVRSITCNLFCFGHSIGRFYGRMNLVGSCGPWMRNWMKLHDVIGCVCDVVCVIVRRIICSKRVHWSLSIFIVTKMIVVYGGR